MKSKFILCILILFGTLLFYKNETRNVSSPLINEGCLHCHETEQDPSSSHPIASFGCTTCHLGNPHTFEKKRAHHFMISNPGDLNIVDTTCGRVNCHKENATQVKNSLMATNAGMKKKLATLFKEAPLFEQTNRFEQATFEKNTFFKKDFTTDLKGSQNKSMAFDLYSKMCATCHLGKKKDDVSGEIGQKGGGCSSCHIVGKSLNQNTQKKFMHPQITTRIPSSNCIKCHNRSARIGLSYFGKYESAGYGTPFEDDGLSQRKLSGKRFYMNLPADIHYQKARMECIDCHTRTGIMGNDISYENMSDQVDITCNACHAPKFSSFQSQESLAYRLGFLNQKMPLHQEQIVALTKKGTPIYNLRKEKAGIYFYRKMDGHRIKMKVTTLKEPHHSLNGHDRLTCQACHSTWMPQCYGCHYAYRLDQKQWDWLLQKKTPGKWIETRSYIRFFQPSLGVRNENRIMPLSPCQTFISVFDKNGDYQPRLSFQKLTITSFDPHTTQKYSRTCFDCHSSTKTLGFGIGLLIEKNQSIFFRSSYDASSSDLQVDAALDTFIDPKIGPLQAYTNSQTRPFDESELGSILSVRACLPCHEKYTDSIYINFKSSLNKFRTNKNLPCFNVLGKKLATLH